MRSQVDVICRQEGYVIGFVRYPYWNIKEHPIYLSEERFDKEYEKDTSVVEEE